ncbi:deoxyribodipyrimidine photolyase [Leptospira sp. 2 VSF19]|uniref:Deoxyribodipyrimidine photo-lyase n=1 Tax=Leptospira soteropolitanensis TaxID=2950025 RepID=A0AAW5VEE6_9LEPT|nr:deoxyribodipyrimidine photolyase [Leptospira soteropolitanensis]MCW7493666.1 deoxyribodipyrimidine photolyase [Leptospira soteropolitanensis]MCW7501264.1 deoxyribodipyrimidine photolyase [Leptospira soteropolitanensis]MCW7523550.1 deoxyribodipyrimidine photolyase [Leptospira soteropolitanensis]MCW7527378.1 deoxyribodipyrimidine photolyase [Leptospira soteropolitanensis]MCW7531234.1 deoxyribodipyrimidine photolyase [Leptospira soteropolitanensis]
MNQDRIRSCNQNSFSHDGKYILYWMQAYRRFDSNHAFAYATSLAKKYSKELIVYEGLRSDYPWNSKRIHKFILEGMYDNQTRADELGINYWPFVETKTNPAKGILKAISKDAAAIVTDDFPCFIIPEQTTKLASKVNCPLYAVDSNSLLPFSRFEKEASAARILRIWIHKEFLKGIPDFTKQKWEKKDLEGLHQNTKPPKNFGLPKDLDTFLNTFAFKEKVLPAKGVKGGRNDALKILKTFLSKKLNNYETGRSQPNSQELTATSGLSPYLHFGHIGIEEIFTSVLEASNKGKWNPERMSYGKPGDREHFYSESSSANHFLDELITWRDIGFLFFWKDKPSRIHLGNLPDWVKNNFNKHKLDTREYLYTLEQFESAKTHDELWNAAQTELVKTGRMHNYMRMLWGKKVIEWSKSYEEAFLILEHLNNKYAYDGRNPNSYTGILWCFGLFDRPWFPERNVFGNVRFMSSDSTKKKFKMNSYLQYIGELSGNSDSLFP